MQMTRIQETEKSEAPSLKYSGKDKRLDKFSEFEMVDLPRSNYSDFEQVGQAGHLGKVYGQSRSLKMLVGNSVAIRSRRNSMSSEEGGPSRKSSISFNGGHSGKLG